ncbi:PfkB family carbohydrate kinase [Tepidiforma sp.]|uniref:PfkB family carbohydrate kinase n=1 Tax=Tepidiforma sp. TaxID=2682230 RepID=UPI0021DDCF34|nr:PfkB family carbohydrate kinase [Tepidiforma sp.]MCX7618088.1 PfkB family carbohydrate kinase [Tepidiforma sp.]GIW16951.1 MAG: adenosine kinase [Tepidiforma sp.]
MSLLIAGWVAIDEIETPFERREGSLGGSATCAALAASLFTEVRLLAAVGEDFPDEMRRALERPGIDLAGLEVVPGGETSRWGGRYHYDMNSRDTLYTVLGVNAAWEPKLPPGWEDSSGLFAAAGDPVLQQRLMAMVPGARTKMVDTIKFFIDGARDELMNAIRAADVVSINESEARELAGVPSIARAGRKLLDGGTKAVVIKLGEYGAAYISGEDYFVAPGYPLEEVVDPTGAGDAFAGGFMGYLDAVPVIDQREIRRAIIYGSTVASFCVEGFGPSRLLTLERDEVEQRYRQFRALTHFEVGD